MEIPGCLFLVGPNRKWFLKNVTLGKGKKYFLMDSYGISCWRDSRERRLYRLAEDRWCLRLSLAKGLS